MKTVKKKDITIDLGTQENKSDNVDKCKKNNVIFVDSEDQESCKEEITDNASIKKDCREDKDASKVLIEKYVKEIEELKKQNEKLLMKIKETQDELSDLKHENISLEIKVDALQEECKKSQCNEDALNTPEIVNAVLSDMLKIKNIAENSLNYLKNKHHTKISLDNITEKGIKKIKRPNSVEKGDDRNGDQKGECSYWENDVPMSKKVKTEDIKAECNSSNHPTYEINSQILHNARKDTLDNYVNDLLNSEELAMSSVTGRACNANKTGESRPALDPARLKAIEAIVFKKFGNNKMTRTRLRYVAKNKFGAKRLLLKQKKDEEK